MVPQEFEKIRTKVSHLWSANPYGFLTILMFLIHGLYGTVTIYAKGLSLESVLNHWDSGWYTQIIKEGYHGPNFAFYPLYPLTIYLLDQVTFHTIPVPLLGSLFSSTMFVLSAVLVQRLAKEGELAPAFPDPVSPLGWFLVAWTPASYVFHTHHTESLFLWLSLVAFTLMSRNQWILGSLAAGLCALTKNQGIFVAITLGVWAALNHRPSPKLRVFLRFAASGLISGLIFGLYPLFCYFKTGNPLEFYQVQLHWRPEMSEGSYFKSFWFDNPWQNTNRGSMIRYGLFWLLTASSLYLLLIQRKISGLYSLLFVGIMPLSGEFVGTFRYSSVLFPIWFGIAEGLRRVKPGIFAPLMVCITLVLLYLNIDLWRSFLLYRWSY